VKKNEKLNIINFRGQFANILFKKLTMKIARCPSTPAKIRPAGNVEQLDAHLQFNKVNK